MSQRSGNYYGNLGTKKAERRGGAEREVCICQSTLNVCYSKNLKRFVETVRICWSSDRGEFKYAIS